MSKSNHLTTNEYWNSGYALRGKVLPLSLDGFRNRALRLIFHKKLPLLASAETVLELGGGASSWLPFMARQFPDKHFSSLDYSCEGNYLLRDYCSSCNIDNVTVHHGDFFDASSILGPFDLVYSCGVVEHFSDLRSVLRAHSRFLSPQGLMMVTIPNMAGFLGLLSKYLDRSVYDLHIPYDLQELISGHGMADLDVVDAGFLCSNNFAVLSSCIENQWSLKSLVYKLLVTVSLSSWWLEERLGSFPETSFFSPYLYVVSRPRFSE